MQLTARSSRKQARATVLASGLFDQRWVEAQTARTFRSAEAAVDAYLAAPPGEDLSPHPLFLPSWITPDAGRPPADVDPLLWYLGDPHVRATASTHPLVEPTRILAEHPEYADAADGPLAEWLRHADACSPMPSDPADPATSLGDVLADAHRGLAQWPGPAPAVEVGRTREPGRTSLVIAGLPNVRSAQRWARLVSDDPSWELVLVDAVPQRWQYLALRALAVAHHRLVLAHTAEPQPAPVQVDVAAAAASGERLVLALEPFEHDLDAVRRLAAVLGDRAAVAQPVVVDRRSRLVQSAGAVFPTPMTCPEPLLHEHPLTDLPNGGPLRVPAALGPVVAVSADTHSALGGLDADLGDALAVTDLSLRARARGLGDTVLVPDAVVAVQAAGDRADVAAYSLLASRHPLPPPGTEDVWRRLGFEVLGHRTRVAGVAPAQREDLPDDLPLLVPASVVAPVRAAVTEEPPRLRWTIDLAAPPGALGEGYGDTPYGRALAAALRRRGQRVAVDNRAARHRSTRDLDDVVLVLRGLDRVLPRPGALNVEWVISHPELVSAEEVAPFDLVYAASNRWAADVTATWGIQVRGLLQATDPALFHTDRAEFDTGAGVLFVGNSRRVFRSSLRHALEAGVEVEIHGNGWGPILGDDAVTSIRVENGELGAMYAAAGVVLNDHWDDMRQLGFVSNRLMDAAACGARVVSDPVPGIDLTAMFEGLVLTHETTEELAHILAHRDELFPSAPERVAAAARVRGQHSFDVRAEALLADVVALWTARRRRSELGQNS